jgi:hypothetical protein
MLVKIAAMSYGHSFLWYPGASFAALVDSFKPTILDSLAHSLVAYCFVYYRQTKFIRRSSPAAKLQSLDKRVHGETTIAAYRQRGVAIHSATCPPIAQFAPSRYVLGQQTRHIRACADPKLTGKIIDAYR